MSQALLPATSPTPRGFRAALPNSLTLLRVALALLFVAMLSAWRFAEWPIRFGTRADPLLLAAAAVFVVAALSDALDGWLARRWAAVTRFGRVMDPFADKLLVIGAFVMLASPAFQIATTSLTPRAEPFAVRQITGVEPWMVVVILARELLVTSIRGVFEARGVDFSATLSGKLKMVLQSICVPAVLCITAWGPPASGSPAAWTIDGLVWTTVAVTAWSAVPYVLRAVRAARAAEGAP